MAPLTVLGVPLQPLDRIGRESVPVSAEGVLPVYAARSYRRMIIALQQHQKDF